MPRDWNLRREQLPALTLAADVRLDQMSYTNDQVWELFLSGGEPPAITVQTTYGLRARGMRLFPSFSEGDKSLSDPGMFDQPPAIHRFFPNYALVSCAPFPGVDVVLEYRVFSHEFLGGRLRIINSSVTPRRLGLTWNAVLIPGAGGERMGPAKKSGINILVGRLETLRPVVFLSGGPEASHSPLPALSVKFDLLPGMEQQFFWGHAALAEEEAAFELARSVPGRRWEAEIARLEVSNGGMVDIETGNKEWDLVFSLGQKAALHLVHEPVHLPFPAPVQTRRPDQGYSLQKDGSDYPPLWSGQGLMDQWYLAQQLLPAAPEIARGLLMNYMKTQNRAGEVELKPGINGKTSGLLATPLLVDLAWRIYLATEDKKFLEEVFPGLLGFISAWFSAAVDRDGDGLPEWSHPMQTGYEDHPLFMPWEPWSQGMKITFLESPALFAMLHREIKTLGKIAAVVGRQRTMQVLETRAARLYQALQETWQEELGAYVYLDRDGHTAPAGKALGQMRGAGTLYLDHHPESPARVVVRIHQENEPFRNLSFVLIGQDASEKPQVEKVSPEEIRWSLQLGTWISARLYSHVDRLEISQAQPGELVKVSTVDYRFHDQTLLAPLWAGCAPQERAQQLIKKHIFSRQRYWQPYGLPACEVCPDPGASRYCETAWLPWNQLIGEGLLRYGERSLAAELVGRLMEAITQSVRRDGVFRQFYHAKTGEGIGERDALSGLPPLPLFLQTLGVQLISPWKVALEGENPYPWDVKIRYRGLTILRGVNETVVTFPDGRSIQISDPAPCVVRGRPGA